MPLQSTRGGASAKGFGFTAGAAIPAEVDYLVVAGGGGGGCSGGSGGGGGGAGGFRTSFPGGTALEIRGTVSVTVGAGGSPAPGGPALEDQVLHSIFSTIHQQVVEVEEQDMATLWKWTRRSCRSTRRIRWWRTIGFPVHLSGLARRNWKHTTSKSTTRK
jgi:mono/diheme cytochrome c family protein